MIFISSHEESTSALRLQEGSAFSAQEYTPFFAAVIFLYSFFDFILLQFWWLKVCYAVERSVRIREVEGSNPFRSTTKSCEISCFTAFLKLFGEIYMDANRAFRANFGDFREY